MPVGRPDPDEVLVSDSSEVDQNSDMGKRLRKIYTEIAECQL